MTFKPHEFYRHVDGVTVLCGSCVAADIRKTQTGEYTGDEAVRADDYEPVGDSDEPYQCDDCLKQNDAYEELGEEP